MLLALIKHIIPRHRKACLPLLCCPVININTCMFGEKESGKKRPYYVWGGGGDYHFIMHIFIVNYE